MSMTITSFVSARTVLINFLAIVTCSYYSGHAYSSDEIIAAIRCADSTAVANMLQESPDSFMVAGEAGCYPIHIACDVGSAGITTILLESGCSLDCRDSIGRIPIHHAIVEGHREITQLLIKYRSPVSVQDHSGRTPLFYAFFGGDRESVNILLDNGASIADLNTKNDMILCSAAELGYEVLVDSLMGNLKDPTIRNPSGGTLLHSAAAGGLCRLASTLIDSGASLFTRNVYGQTPLHCAASNGHADMIDLLLARGAYIDARDAAGYTPLRFSQVVRHDAVTRLLISRGADVSGGRFNVFADKYVSKNVPSQTPELFAPGVVSSVEDESGGVWMSASGEELYFSRVSPDINRGAIFVMQYRNERWSPPRPVSFSSDVCHDCSPALSHDGTRLFFCSCREKNGNHDTSASVWMSIRNSGGWERPKPVSEELSNIPSEGGIAISDSDCLYFPAQRPDGLGSCDIYMAKHTEEGYIEAENLGPTVNTRYGECCSYVDAEERFLIFASDRPGGYGSWDLYISIHLEDGSWGEAVNAGETINTSADERNATLSPDGSVLFFLSNRSGNLDYFWVQSNIAERNGLETS